MLRAAVLLLFAALAHAQGIPVQSATIDGAVTDSSMRPLQDVKVSLLRTQVEVTTGENGRFRIRQLPAGQYVIVVRRVGYHPVSEVIQVLAGDTLRAAYELEPMAVSLPGVTVTEARRGWRELDFEMRRKRGLGEFMSREQLDKKSATPMSIVMYSFNSIRVVDGRGGMESYAVAKRGPTSILTSPCVYATILLDGIPLPDKTNLSDLPPARELAGIEVYGGAAASPAQYSIYDKGCGLILLWRRT
jgi:hypothetical protein